MRVSNQLDLDVPRLLDEFFHENPIVSKADRSKNNSSSRESLYRISRARG